MFDRRGLIALAGIAAAMPWGLTLAAGNASRPINTLGSPEGVAIRGYDPVAYFRDGGPRPGKPEFTAAHGGAVWRFASAEHKALFQADPERYVPAFGGYCAYGTSRGYLVKIEPEAWSIIDGRLYLNYDLGVRETWSGDARTYISRAATNWPRLIRKPVR